MYEHPDTIVMGVSPRGVIVSDLRIIIVTLSHHLLPINQATNASCGCVGHTSVHVIVALTLGGRSALY